MTTFFRVSIFLELLQFSARIFHVLMTAFVFALRECVQRTRRDPNDIMIIELATSWVCTTV